METNATVFLGMNTASLEAPSIETLHKVTKRVPLKNIVGAEKLSCIERERTGTAHGCDGYAEVRMSLLPLSLIRVSMMN